MKKFKKVYVEITNKCNLSCPFCIKTKRENCHMSISEVELVFQKLQGVTKYVYLHVLGEPLLHPDFDKILNLAEKYNLMVNVTTNGTLLNKWNLSEFNSLRQINISLHSANSLDDAISRVEAAKSLNKIVNFRLWQAEEDFQEKMAYGIISAIYKIYKNETLTEFDISPTKRGVEVTKNVYIHISKPFNWPSLSAPFVSNTGFCLGLRNQFAVLSNLDVIPCCLDAEGVIKLGNLAENTVDEIMNFSYAKEIYDGFSNRKIIADLCKHCSFRNQF